MPGSNHLLQQIKQKKTERKNKDALRKMYSIRCNKKYSVLKDDLIFADEEGGLGASPSFDACTS
jgi:plasmid maintenance system killer protein